MKTFLNKIHYISAILACSFLGFQLIIISTNVILRYCFNSGISWMEEISQDVLMPAFTFLSLAIGVKMADLTARAPLPFFEQSPTQLSVCPFSN